MSTIIFLCKAKIEMSGMYICVGHSPQTRSFAPAASFPRVRLRNFCLAKDRASSSLDGLLRKTRHHALMIYHHNNNYQYFCVGLQEKFLMKGFIDEFFVDEEFR
jgi:hypothetical protein